MRIATFGLVSSALLTSLQVSAEPASSESTPDPQGAPAEPSGAETATSTLLGARDLSFAPTQGEAPHDSSEWAFTMHGFARFPMMIGVGRRPRCPDGVAAGTGVTTGGSTDTSGGGAVVPCAGVGQSTTALHSPFVPDSQIQDWRYDRQQEYNWTELFFNYGNPTVTLSVGIQAFGLSDSGYIGATNAGTQLGIAQAYLTLRPNVGIPGLQVKWKVGSFWDRYGMAADYDAGKYDTYMFGRTHQMGETLSAEYKKGGIALRASHGVGTRAEQIAFTQLQAGNFTLPQGNENNYPGFTLLHHAHAGVSFGRRLDIDAHYLSSFTQDYRAVGALQGTVTDGHIDVYGAEATLRAGRLGGRLYVAYSHILATNPQAVGPVNEVVHSSGGGNYESNGGVLNNFFGCSQASGSGIVNAAGSGNCEQVQNSLGAAHGSVDNVEIQYDNTISHFWNGSFDVNLSLFGMFSAVSSSLTSDEAGTKMLGNGVNKLKYGADLVVVPLSWFGFGARADVVAPTDLDKEQTFTVLSPKLIFKSKFVTHEEVTLWYSHYWYGSSVMPQPPNGVQNPDTDSSGNGTVGGPTGPFPPDQDVVGIKGTAWW